MADLVLQVGDSSNPEGYEDGDILCAFNDRRILHVHSEHACSPRKHPDRSPRVDGFLVRGTLFEDFCSLTCRYRFERISRREVRRVDIDTLAEEVFSDVPKLLDGKTQHINVQEWINRRLESRKHKIFGATGTEVWFGKSRIPSLASLDTLWVRIEAETLQLKADHTMYPLSNRELAIHLTLRHVDFDDAQRGQLTSLLYDKTDPENWVTVKKRANRMDYQSIWPTRVADIEDRSKIVDFRSETARTPSDVIIKTGGGR